MDVIFELKELRFIVGLRGLIRVIYTERTICIGTVVDMYFERTCNLL